MQKVQGTGILEVSKESDVCVEDRPMDVFS
jgi:hypothetical protein